MQAGRAELEREAADQRLELMQREAEAERNRIAAANTEDRALALARSLEKSLPLANIGSLHIGEAIIEQISNLLVKPMLPGGGLRYPKDQE